MVKIDQFIKTIHGAVLSANDTLMKENLKLLDTYFEEAEDDEKSNLKARTVALQFPEQTSNGTVMKNVHVPLIALVPVSMSQISEVRFKTDLELQVKNDELLVSFPSTAAKKESLQSGNNNTASIEITLSPQESPEGLKRLIEGYEKLLRSQIPN